MRQSHHHNNQRRWRKIRQSTNACLKSSDVQHKDLEGKIQVLSSEEILDWMRSQSAQSILASMKDSL